MHVKKREHRSEAETAPPTKRTKFQEGSRPSSSQANSGHLTEIGSRLRDWMSWMAQVASNTPVLSRLFPAAETTGQSMSAQEPKKKWRVRKNPVPVDEENVTLTRLPLHTESRWKSLNPSSYSSGNPFVHSGVQVQKKVSQSAIAIIPSLDLPSVQDGACGFTAPSVPKDNMRPYRRKNRSRRNMHTAIQTVRLEEKEKYQLLINQHSKGYEGFAHSMPSYQSKGIQTERAPPRFGPQVSAFTRESLSAESKKNMTKWLQVDKQPPSERSDNLEQVHSDFHFEMVPEIVDSDLEITRVEMPVMRRAESLHSRDSPFFSSQWIQDLKKTISMDCKENKRMTQEQERKARLLQEKREARLSSENMKLFERVKQLSILPESPEASDEEDDISQYPEMTSGMDVLIDDALRPSPPDEILVEGFRLSVTRRDMETLAGLNWLNDEIINFFTNMLMERGKMDNYPSVYAFNTFFYPKLISSGHSALKRWTRKIDIFSYNYILIPVHLGMHWCLAVIDFLQKKIQYYDSMGGQNNECLQALRCYLREESLDKKKTDFNMNDWKMEAVKNIPHQMNGSDCGMFALKYAEYITRNSKITFTQAHMPYFRRRMVYEILKKQLL